MAHLSTAPVSGGSSTSATVTPLHDVVPLNEIIRTCTDDFLARLDTDEPQDPTVIEASLLDYTNTRLRISNATREKDERLSMLKTLTFRQVAELMLKLHHICRIMPSGRSSDRDYDILAIYVDEGPDRGIYIDSEDAFRQVARQYNYQLSKTDFAEIMTVVFDRAPRRERCLDPDMIPVNNGIFNYRTKELLEFTPELVFRSKSCVDYVESASNPVYTNPDNTTWDVETWMASLSDDPAIVELLWEITGAMVRPLVRWNKAAFLYSAQGNNGKGTLCTLWRNLVGPAACAVVPLADFGKDFALEPLARASAIVVDENDVGTFIDKAANLKAVVTNDVITINRKHKSIVSYQFYGFMVQCLNEFPRIKDQSESFYRRQLFIPMEKSFEGVERKYIKSDYLGRTAVLEYVLHRVLHMNYYKFTESLTLQTSLETYKEANDPVRAFFNEFEHEFVWRLLPYSFLYDLYTSWFKEAAPSGTPIGRNTFILRINELVAKSDHWKATKENAIRIANRMDAPEPMISRYNLKYWKNPNYSGSNIDKICSPVLANRYRGIYRITSGPIPDRTLVIDEPDITDNQDETSLSA